MGVIFTEHPGGLVLYVCRACSTVFANENEHIGIETRNRILKVRAYLFNNVVNVTYSKIDDERYRWSGIYTINCKKCSTFLGLMCENPHTGFVKHGYMEKHVMDDALISVLEGFHET